MTIRKFILSTAALCLTAPAAVVAQPANMQMFSGQCSDSSHTAEGPLGSDLTKRRSRFYCDSAVISGKGDRLLIQFAEKQSNEPNAVLGFAGGPVQADTAGAGVVMPIYRIYLAAGKATTVDDGSCKFFLKGEAVTGLVCGAKVDVDQRRFVAVVAFDVKG